MSRYSHSGRDDGTCTETVVDSGVVQRVRALAANTEHVGRTTAIFSALSDPTRFRILEALACDELCVCDLAEIARVSQSAASHQLRLLRDRGLVSFHRDGNRAIYRLADDHVRHLITIGLQHADEDVVR